MSTNRSGFSFVLWACLLFIALAHAFVAAHGMRDKSTTSDEIAHVTGGYTFNRLNDYRMHPENGLLPQRWAALPASLGDAVYPDFSSIDWRFSNVWKTGADFFYSGANDLTKLLGSARAMNTVWGAASILLVAWWSWQLFGAAGALTSALLAAMCPTFLAHSPIATSDMAMCFFLLASVTAYWRHLHDGRVRSLVLSCAVFGLACVAKFTAVLLPVMMVPLAALRLFNRDPLRCGTREYIRPTSRFGAIAASFALHAVTGFAVIWTFCGWRYSAFNPELPPGEFMLTWTEILSFGGWKAQVIEFCRTWKLLPEGFIYGFSHVVKYSQLRGAFLDGEYSLVGWVSFFPKAFLYKTPPSLLAALAASGGLLLLWVRQRGTTALRAQLHRTAPLLALFTVYWGISLGTNLNIGHRHILPTYPVLYIFCGIAGWAAVAAWRARRTSGVVAGVLLTLLLGWHALEASRIHPHHLAYFSPLVGGPTQGYRHLVDSSLDWGQDLPGLKRWLDRERRAGERVYLSYFGTGSPEYEGIDAIMLPRLPGRSSRPRHLLEPGIYAIGATMLQHGYSPLQGPWTAEREERYRQLRANEAAFVSPNPNPGPDEPTPEQWEYAWSLYEPLRFARLCHYLRVRKPDAMIGYSILVFRLNDEELNAVLRGSVEDFAAAVDKAAAGSP